MAEGTFDQAYRPQERQHTRRNFLIKGAATIAGLFGAYKLIESTNQVKVEEPEIPPRAILEGKVRILKQGLRLRKDPSKLDDFVKDDQGHDVNQNAISWSQIESLNGVPFHQHDEFFVENPEIAYGYNPDNTLKQDGIWIRFRAVRDWPQLGAPLEKRESYAYVNISNQTKPQVQTESSKEKIYNVTKIEGSNIQTEGKAFQRSEIGKITFPNK